MAPSSGENRAPSSGSFFHHYNHLGELSEPDEDSTSTKQNSILNPTWMASHDLLDLERAKPTLACKPISIGGLPLLEH
uniref:Uncharacterized protein n=1 Tax=Brassica oleracea TaxID=3712 RepID=A0A3P6G2W8_BRAOL|nr:unnamed protein product [Brassica oleracea]